MTNTPSTSSGWTPPLGGSDSDVESHNRWTRTQSKAADQKPDPRRTRLSERLSELLRRPSDQYTTMSVPVLNRQQRLSKPKKRVCIYEERECRCNQYQRKQHRWWGKLERVRHINRACIGYTTAGEFLVYVKQYRVRGSTVVAKKIDQLTARELKACQRYLISPPATFSE